jgi:autotransporter strand-loop-strand O-heptosyltransferase
MSKSISFYASFNERTGYGIHGSRLCEAFEKVTTVYRNKSGGDVSISLIDSVSIQNVTERLPYPSLLLNAWESTLQPDWFINQFNKYFDGLLVVSEWQRACSIAQGIPEEKVFVVPEGVDPEIYKPGENLKDNPAGFTFLHIGQWQPRKSTLEIIQAYQKAFPIDKDPLGQRTQLQLSVDTLFPSDTYKSTEERLTANGISDPRISVIHFEEKSDYVRRLQSANCFVSCSRSEGWGLPISDAMGCGIPTIVADWGGSTEFAADAIRVKIRELRKPTGIYGGWDVPGQWAEPDYDDLVEKMQDVYTNYTTNKEKALKTSDTIRTKFSWDAAAKKAIQIIEQIPTTICQKSEQILPTICNPEKEIRTHARNLGYDVIGMQKRKVIFTIDCHPTSSDKMDTLIETISQIKAKGFPVLIASHIPLPAPVVEMADFYIYDKRDVLSGDDKPIYWRQLPNGKQETTKASIPCHAVASTMNVRNAVDYCLGKFDWMYHICYDTEFDLDEWLLKVNASDKSLICSRWDHQEKTITGQLFAAKLEVMDKIILKTTTWEEFAKIHGDKRFNSEEVLLERVAKEIGMENVEILDIELGNRFDQVDRDAWKDDIFACHFIDGPFLNIQGMSNREYDVSFSNPIDGDNCYNLKQKVGMWSRPNTKFYRDWMMQASLNGELKFKHHLELKNQRVLISMGSKALGDTLAWMPYIEEFRKKHDCHLVCSSWWNRVLDYPDIEFVEPGAVVENIYASYSVGCYDDQLDKNPINWRLVPLQKVATDILGLEHIPQRAKLKKSLLSVVRTKPYICFSEYSTMLNKQWNNPGAWQKVIDYLNSIGYNCISISLEPSQLQNVIKHNNQSAESTIADIAGADFYIGLNHGPAWIAYSLDIPVVMIDGVAEEWNNPSNLYRISVDVEGCKKCFNNLEVPIDRSWDWCYNKTERFACTKLITPEMVISTIDNLRKDQHGCNKTASNG